MNEEQGHGELFGAMIESRINDHFAKTKRQRSPLAKKLKGFVGSLKGYIEDLSPVVVIHGGNGPTAYYGSTIPRGHVVIVIVEELEKPGEPPIITSIGGEFRKDDAKHFGAQLQEEAKKMRLSNGEKNRTSTVFGGIADIVLQEARGNSELCVSRTLHALYGYAGVTKAACEMIDDGIVPAYIIFLMRPTGVFAIFAPFLYAMHPEVEASIELLDKTAH